MRLLKQLFSFYISSHIHVALAVFLLTKLTLISFEITDNTVPTFVFFATVLSYNFIQIYETHGFQVFYKSWFQLNWKRTLLIVVSTIFLFLLSFQLKLKDYLLLIPFALVTFYYAVPVLGLDKNLRSITTIKLFLIALTWAGVTVMFPIINNELTFTNDIWIVFIQRFLFIIGITIPFDIRDVNLDMPEIKTLPQIIGVKNSKIVGIVALLLFFMIDFLKPLHKETSFLITFIVALVSVLFLVFSGRFKNKYYCSFWVEGIPFLWFALVYCTNALFI